MNVKLKIYFTDKDDKQFMGIGVYWLLMGIKKYGSIRKAAAEMKLSYVKALGMLNNLESSLNKKIVLRRRGGDTRDGTTLTETGENLVKQYDAYQEKVKSFAEEEFKLLVPHFLD
ncbi:MAG: LysR family transcriptional regulator [Spirochaetales bacterium]|nr:LysR family transcriptional regulator [Spirochaetales bacterium]